ncbi:MAG: cyclic nucleotide-binding domain-containing protein [Thermotogaceae bacterium]|nr:cyclic nucleotide-binding domain-containing protein [Fervidobacterium sp.]MBP8657372.1 cyclic nucleotide-binding domain-containing protein [Fervidobacterium sp.]NLH37781.1 cyclic nucleotide-binding domain-containing protein [Thermotogaceae bacterium]
METMEFEPGQDITKDGEKGEYVYILKSGKVKIRLGLYEFVVDGGGPEVFGLESLVGENYTETCTALENSKVIRCSSSEFMEIYGKTEVGKKALESFMRRTAKVLGWI